MMSKAEPLIPSPYSISSLSQFLLERNDPCSVGQPTSASLSLDNDQETLGYFFLLVYFIQSCFVPYNMPGMMLIAG